MAMVTEQDKYLEHAVKKLHKVFIEDHYRKARNPKESYDVPLKNGAYAYSIVNCLGHVLNLQNKQFDDYNFKPYPLFGSFPGLSRKPLESAAEDIFYFFKQIGLKIEEYDPTQINEDFCSWIAALYFEDNQEHHDFHFILQEYHGLWSSKIGFEPCKEHLCTIVPPERYRNLVDNDAAIYNLFKVIKITNPKADENCRYLKNFNFNRTGYKANNLPRQYVVEDARNNTFDKLFNELMIQ